MITVYESTDRNAAALSPEHQHIVLDRRNTVIILDRDGSLHHYPPDEHSGDKHSATVLLPSDCAGALHPSMLDRVLAFVLDMLGARAIDMRLYEDCR
jgi:hypothetical protein